MDIIMLNGEMKQVLLCQISDPDAWGVLSINQPDQVGISKIVNDVEAAIVLVDTEHTVEVKTHGITKYDPVYAAMGHDGDIMAFMLLEDEPETIINPH